MDGDRDEVVELARIRERIARAEMEGDTSFFGGVLTDDAVIMAPWRPVLEARLCRMVGNLDWREEDPEPGA